MARNRDEARSELTQRAAAQGIDIAPGQLEAAGLMEADELEAEREEAPPFTGPVFWRVKIVNQTVNDPGAHNHVVRAADRANAWETFRREMGVTSVDETVNKREIAPATEAEYVLAQAKRLRVDLREHRADKGSKKPSPLTWQAPGGVAGKYLVSNTGELTVAEE